MQGRTTRSRFCHLHLRNFTVRHTHTHTTGAEATNHQRNAKRLKDALYLKGIIWKQDVAAAGQCVNYGAVKNY